MRLPPPPDAERPGEELTTGLAEPGDTALLKTAVFGSHKLPVMLQAEAAEFGLACLAMVAAFHGQRRSLSELRRLFSASIKGTTLKSLMDMADGLGFTARPVRLEVGLRLATLSLENSNDHCRYEK